VGRRRRAKHGERRIPGLARALALAASFAGFRLLGCLPGFDHFPPHEPTQAAAGPAGLEEEMAARDLPASSEFALGTPAPGPSARGALPPEERAYEGVPYSLPVELPEEVSSPAVEKEAPYTPTVVSLLEQLLPDEPTPAEVNNAVAMLNGAENPTCYAAGTNGAPTGTKPVVMPLCWVDAQGINWLFAGGETTAPMELVGLAASFDRRYANAWGQVEGKEGRQLMATGLLGPQVDLIGFVNWARAVNSSSGEDPFLGSVMAAAQINGLQGAGLMSQVKHFGPYGGTNEEKNVTVQDQAMHENVLAPFEAAVKDGAVAALMASYQIFRLDAVEGAGRAGLPLRSMGSPLAWPLDESHYSSENPWLLSYVLRDLWGAKAFVGPDYGAIHSSSSIVQGLDMEPSADYLGKDNPTRGDPTGATCADARGDLVPCSAVGARHVAGIPSPACGPYGCGVAQAVKNRALPVSFLRQALARMLYQQERFGLLGCDNHATSCANPGGVGGDRTGKASLPVGRTHGPLVVGTKNGDAAIAEKGAELGAVLLKNEQATLPIRPADLSGGIAVAGSGAQYLVAAPFDEAATGFADRDAISPLNQLRTLSGQPSAFTYSPVDDATGRPVPSQVLSTLSTAVNGHLARSKDEGAPTDEIAIDYTTASASGRLPPGRYVWSGYLYVPRTDLYTFRFQYSRLLPDDDFTFTLDGGRARTLEAATPVYHGYYYGSRAIPVSPTVAGYVEAGLANRECRTSGPREPAGTEAGPGYRPAIPNPCPARLTPGYHALEISLRSDRATSFRFAYSRAQGDLDDAADEARGKALAVVFANDDQVAFLRSQPILGEVSDATAPIAPLPPAQEALIRAVAAANPRTVVVLNTGTPVIIPWVVEVRSVLEMWNAGQEGGTATARLLLGSASPSGHTPLTWPKQGTDTTYGYDEPPGGLYPGSTGGRHPERLNGLPDGSSSATQGIFVGYRYYDQLGIPVLFPFGHGLSYTTFDYGRLEVQTNERGVTVTFTVRNSGKRAGAAVPQVYVGPAAKVPSYVQQAVRALRGFDRVELGPGETRRLSIALGERAFEYWDSPSQSWVTGAGERTLWVGEGLDDLRLSGTVQLEARRHP